MKTKAERYELALTLTAWRKDINYHESKDRMDATLTVVFEGIDGASLLDKLAEDGYVKSDVDDGVMRAAFQLIAEAICDDNCATAGDVEGVWCTSDGRDSLMLRGTVRLVFPPCEEYALALLDDEKKN